MRPIATVFGCLVLLGVVLYAVWFIGICFEVEYPYTFTLHQIRNSAVSYSGVPVSDIIKSNSAYSQMNLHWHTCSYDVYGCRLNNALLPVKLFQLDSQGNTVKLLDMFAYSKRTHVLVPMTEATALHFPALMPKNDTLVAVHALDSNALATGNGIGEAFELPEKWFKDVTGVNANN
jgi:hypothetical protein